MKSLAARAVPSFGLIAFLTLAAHAPSGAQATSMVTTDSLRSACQFIESADTATHKGSASKDLLQFCRAPLTAKTWGAEIPSIDVVLAAVRGTLVDGQFDRAVGIAAAPPTFKDVLTARLPSESVILTGLTNFVVDRAVAEVREFIIRDFAKNLCTRVVLKKGVAGSPEDVTTVTFLPATCELLTSEGQKTLSDQGLSLPSWGLLKTTLLRDADTLSDVVIGRLNAFALSQYPRLIDDPKAAAAAQRILAMQGSARLAISLVKRHDIPGAFREVALTVSATIDSVCKVAPKMVVATAADDNHTLPAQMCGRSWERFTTAQAILIAATTLGGISTKDFHTLLRNPSSADFDEAIALTSKALLVNGRGLASGAETQFRSAVRAAMTSDLGGIDVPVDVPILVEAVRDLVGPIREVALELSTQIEAAKGDRKKLALAYAEGAGGIAGALRVGLDSVPWIPPADTARIRRALVIVERVSRFPSLRVNGDYHQLLADLMSLADLVDEDGKMRAELSRFSLPPGAARAVQFAVDASATTDADGFAAVLEHFAAPANGFMRKRTDDPDKNAMYFGVNAYVGGSGGKEWGKGRNIPDKVGGAEATYAGLFVPVGFEVGFRRKLRGVAFLVQLLDVGQVASWRLNPDSTTAVQSTPPGLTFASVFAPGVNLLYNVQRFPIAIGVGGAYAPQFRDLRKTDIAAQPKASVFRLVAFLAVDVPIFP